MRKKKVAVLYGGTSTEREVSLVTGKAVYDNLNKKKYEPFLIEMTKEGEFFLRTGKVRRIDFENKDRKSFDVVFIALHGSPGEDGSIQGMFETLGIIYTGPKVLASALAMNKIYAGRVYELSGLPHPKFLDVNRKSWNSDEAIILKRLIKEIGLPAVIKPIDQGSAVGVSIVKNSEELKKQLEKTFNKFQCLMVQTFVKGSETTCGVLEIDGKAVALPPTRILPKMGGFYDYKSKYKAGGSTHVCPADFSPQINKAIQELALRAHEVLGCSGMSRTDIFVAGKDLYVIETNTIPGMTATSLFPEAAKAANISFSEMLDHIIAAAYEK